MKVVPILISLTIVYQAKAASLDEGHFHNARRVKREGFVNLDEVPNLVRELASSLERSFQNVVNEGKNLHTRMVEYGSNIMGSTPGIGYAPKPSYQPSSHSPHPHSPPPHPSPIHHSQGLDNSINSFKPIVHHQKKPIVSAPVNSYNPTFKPIKKKPILRAPVSGYKPVKTKPVLSVDSYGSPIGHPVSSQTTYTKPVKTSYSKPVSTTYSKPIKTSSYSKPVSTTYSKPVKTTTSYSKPAAKPVKTVTYTTSTNTVVKPIDSIVFPSSTSVTTGPVITSVAVPSTTKKPVFINPFFNAVPTKNDDKNVASSSSNSFVVNEINLSQTELNEIVENPLFYKDLQKFKKE